MEDKIIAFVHIEKTAGISINHILRSSFGIQHCDVEVIGKNRAQFTKRDLNFAKSIYPNLKSIAGHCIQPTQDLGNCVKYYSFFRNPIDRTLSHYQYQIQVMKKQIDFADWIKIEKYRNFQTKRIAGVPDFEKAKIVLESNFFFIGLTERFEESLDILNQRIDQKLELNYSKRNVANDNAIKKRIRNDKKLLDEAKLANLEDFKTYEYAKSCFENYQKQIQPMIYLKSPSNNQVFYNRLYRNMVYKTLIKIARIF